MTNGWQPDNPNIIDRQSVLDREEGNCVPPLVYRAAVTAVRLYFDLTDLITNAHFRVYLGQSIRSLAELSIVCLSLLQNYSKQVDQVSIKWEILIISCSIDCEKGNRKIVYHFLPSAWAPNELNYFIKDIYLQSSSLPSEGELLAMDHH